MPQHRVRLSCLHDKRDDRNLGYALTGIGLSYLAEGTSTSALVPLERAFKIREAQETDPSHRAETRFALARALWSRPAERQRALALSRSARGDCGDDKKAAAEIDAWLAQARAEKL